MADDASPAAGQVDGALRQLRLALDEARAENAMLREREASLVEALGRRDRDLADAQESQVATGEILRIIAGAGVELQTVLDAIVERATRLGTAMGTRIHLVEGDRLRLKAMTGHVPGEIRPHDAYIPLRPGFFLGRAVLERRTVHTPDVVEAAADFPEVGAAVVAAWGHVTGLAVPLMRGEDAIGILTLNRAEVRPFTDREIALLEAFADQAVIAIENARLFSELQERTADLTSALEQQTALSEVLRIVASSPTSLETVLQSIVQTANHLCEGDFTVVYQETEGGLRPLAPAGNLTPELLDALARLVIPVDTSTTAGRAALEQRTAHEPKVSSITGYGAAKARATTPFDTVLAVPMVRQGRLIGVISSVRYVSRAFTEQQVALLEIFADQAVIAIENARLFEELDQRNRDLSEALELQTATSEILRVIASSPADHATVLDTISAAAARFTQSEGAVIQQAFGDRLRWIGRYGRAREQAKLST